MASHPDRLHLTIGGLGVGYDVALDGAALVYTDTTPWTGYRSARVVPSDADWAAFRAALDAAGVWGWRSGPDYLDPAVLDGTQWAVDVVWGDCAVTARGSNGYPGPDGAPVLDRTPTPAFVRVLNAVRRLLGGLPFQ